MVFLQGCMTHPVLDGPRLLLKAAALAWSIDAGINGPLFSDPLGSAAELPPPTDLTESCTLRPPQPLRPKRRRTRRGPVPTPEGTHEDHLVRVRRALPALLGQRPA